MIEIKYVPEGSQENVLEDILIPLSFKHWKFPVGEVGVKVDIQHHAIDWLAVHWEFENHEEFFVIANLIDAVNDHNKKYNTEPAYISLLLPYLPYSRQDRVCHQGESFALSVFANMINSLFHKVVTLDVHNEEVAKKLFNNFINVPQSACAVNLKDYDWFIAPDAGAAKKIYEHNDVRSGRTKVVTLEKNRIGDKVVYEDLPEDVVLSGKVCVVDDLIDKGNTFISVAKLLDNQQKIKQLDLYVTHGFFTGGVDYVSPYYDNLICYRMYSKENREDVTIFSKGN